MHRRNILLTNLVINPMNLVTIIFLIPQLWLLCSNYKTSMESHRTLNGLGRIESYDFLGYKYLMKNCNPLSSPSENEQKSIHETFQGIRSKYNNKMNE